MAYSTRINDPDFVRYRANTVKYAWIFSFILAAAAVLGFGIYGAIGREMDNPEALYIGMGIGAMFITIAWLTNRSKKGSKTWDGMVSDKKVEKKKRRRHTTDQDHYMQEYMLYTVTVTSEGGKRHEITAENDDTLYHYYQVGDKVRFHGRLGTYEKFDKSRDTIIFCNACASLNEMTSDRCFRCNCPLLK